MAFSDEVEVTHKDLGAVSWQFLQYVRENPSASEHVDFKKAAESPEWLRSFPYTIQPWPTLIGAEKLTEIKQATEGIVGLIKSIPERAFQNDSSRLAKFWGIDDELLAALLLMPPTGLEGAFARCDFIDSADRGLQCVEVNMGASLGGWQLRFWQELCRNHPPFSRFFEEVSVDPFYRDPLRMMLSHVVDDTTGSIAIEDSLNIAITFDEEDLPQARPMALYFNELYSFVLRHLERPLEGEVFVCSPEGRLRSTRETHLYHGQTRIHALVDCSKHPTSRDVFRAFKGESVTLYNSALGQLLSNKTHLCLLSEIGGSDLFNSEERALIRRHVPWSRIVTDKEVTFEGERISLPQLLKTRREEFVLKPIEGSQGKDVNVGRCTASSQWGRLVETAISERAWLAQVYVDSRPYLFQHGECGMRQHDVVWGTFCYGSAYGGGFLRMSPQHSDVRGVLNASRGASEGIIFEV